MSLPEENYSAILTAAKALNDLAFNGKKITQRDARRILRHFPFPVVLWLIFEGEFKGRVRKPKVNYWKDFFWSKSK